MRDKILKTISENFHLTEKEKKLIDDVKLEDLTLPRLFAVIETMIEYHIQDEVLVAYILFQYFKVKPEEAERLSVNLTKSQKKIYEIFKIIRDVSSLTKGGQAEDIRRMFVAICQDMRVIIIKFATLLYDLKELSLPLGQEQKTFVQMIRDIFAPLAERLGLSKFKYEFEDTCFELLEPEVFEQFKNDALMEKEANQKQINLTTEKLKQILSELEIEGEIQARQKHFYSVYKKLVKKNITLGKVYDLIAMRVLVPTVEDCYSVFGKIHAIYKPIQGRVKDYIANPKPNGYQSLHTTIVADNDRPLEIQIRTFEMHKHAEYGIAAHWIYKEKSRKQNEFDKKLTWFRQMLDTSENLSPDEFLETLKVDLYGESIFVQTPKGKVLEFPLGASVVDFAYAIHSQIGNTCVGGKINGKIVPISTKLSNGDVVEIVTNQNSKGPSRDWLNFVKTSSARSKIRAFFKSQLKEENVRIGKSILEQNLKAKNLVLSKDQKEKYLLEIAKSFMIEELDVLYAEIGAGSLAVASVVGRLVNLYNKDKPFNIKESKITVRKNKEGVLIDGDSGMMIRYALCCTPVMGDDIIGYISRGKGVTIHRANCQNIKYLEPERLISAQWQDDGSSDFVAVIKVETDNLNSVINSLNTAARALKGKLKGFGYKEYKDQLVFEVVVTITNKKELENIMNSFSNLKHVLKVYRSE